MANILITGGLGYVGGRLVQALIKNNKVVVSSRKEINEQEKKSIGIENIIVHNKLLQATTFPSNIDVVIHLAALNEIDCVQFPDKAIEVNINQTRIILENAISSGVKKFIYFSTIHVYGNQLNEEINEQTIPLPTHPYAITHKAAEDYVLAAHINNKIKGVVIRLSNSFGAPLLANVNRWTLLVNDLCKQAIEKNKMVLKSNGCQYRDFICLEDVENVVVKMVNTEIQLHSIYNVASAKPMRVKDMAFIIAEKYKELFKKDITIEFPNDAKETVELKTIISIDRLQKEAFVINNNIEEEIKNLLFFCKKNFN